MTFNLNEHTGVLIKKAARLFERVSAYLNVFQISTLKNLV